MDVVQTEGREQLGGHELAHRRTCDPAHQLAEDEPVGDEVIGGHLAGLNDDELGRIVPGLHQPDRSLEGAARSLGGRHAEAYVVVRLITRVGWSLAGTWF